MASRKLVRDLLVTKQALFQQLIHQRRRVSAGLRLLPENGYLSYRNFSVFSEELSKKIRGEAESKPEFQKTVKEFKEEKAEKEEDLKKVRTKQQQLYKQVDGVLMTEAEEAVAKKISSSVKEKLSAATEEEVKESFKEENAEEDVTEMWETSDNPIVYINEKIFEETDCAAAILRRDPSFSWPDFAAQVQEAIRPVLNAYGKGDTETLNKYCSERVIHRCTAERTAFQNHGFFFDHKILHISEVKVPETELFITSPSIKVRFQTQEIYCVRDRDGKIIEGGQDTIHSVYNEWDMEQVDASELEDDAVYPIWKIRDIRKFGFQALI